MDQSTNECSHVGMPDLVSIPMGTEMPGFEELRRFRDHGEPYWWLWAGECPACGQRWLVAQEERVNDVVVMRRLDEPETTRLIDDGIWPDDFDSYERLIRISQQVQRFRFGNPDEQLRDVIDLANARPGISVSDLADLLNLDKAAALTLSKKAVSEHGAQVALSA
ncbi:MAG: hypothetical protein KJ747_02010 [Actinobacteria bacterium]|nr:hypothetical protein [Actinomycetota bacterium]MCG2807638.1 hypothetical protein [Coriobacteriia bacterium]